MHSDHSPTTDAAQTDHPPFNLQRIHQLVAELERELNNAPLDAPELQSLRAEIATLKIVLNAPENKGIQERLHAVRNGIDALTQKVEGQILKDSPYVAEIGRILGLM